MKIRILLIILVAVIGAGCYTPKVYVKNFKSDYMTTREAALFALKEHGMRLHKSKQLSGTRTMYVGRRGLDPQLWGQEIFLWVENRGENSTDVSFQDIYISQKADIHREIFDFIEEYLALNFEKTAE